MLTVKLYPDSNIVLNDDLKSDLEEIQKLQVSDDITLHIADKVFLSWDSDPKLKPLCFDFLSDKLIYRISHGGKHKENVARAVTSGISHPVVFDATAGMGRDSFILQCAGCSVYMFERNPVIWLLLRDALTRAASSPFFKDLPNGLPSLMPCGEACRYQGDVVPDIIYYDPMFPDRKKSALVKKEMRIFKALIGADEDIESTLLALIRMAKHKVILKRPQTAAPISFQDVKPIGSVEGGACRFDIYMH